MENHSFDDEAKWNLLALTLRNAKANHVMDFLNPDDPALHDPPVLAAPPRPPGL
ncbi:MAG TPA: hypothetical protein VMF07_05930 [Solirubrobacteraceae bacterium]|nr:hypothetical protein [Solirubrobacteraceae bacterium]